MPCSEKQRHVSFLFIIILNSEAYTQTLLKHFRGGQCKKTSISWETQVSEEGHQMWLTAFEM